MFAGYVGFVLAFWALAFAALAFCRSGECRRCKLSGQRAEQAAQPALTAAPVFMRICAGVLGVLGVVTITMHWPWILVVAILVWHVWPTRKPRLV